MKNLYLLLAILYFPAHAQTITKLDGSNITAAALDQKIQQLMQAVQVQGLAVTLFNQNKSVYKKAFGYKNSETREPLKTSTNLYGASLSKAVFAVLIMKLVEEGRLDLDKPLQAYLPKPIYTYSSQTKWNDNYSALRTDSLYHTITARMCLAHTSGFPNWRWVEEDQQLRVKYRPGTKYSYSGEGLVYLQVVLEKMTGKTLEELMLEKVFAPVGMSQSSYTWQPCFEKDYALGHSTQ